MFIPTYYYGNIPVELWELPVCIVLIIGALVLSTYLTRKNIAFAPEYRYLTAGLLAKIFGGIFFALIYILVYQGGDTIGYYASSLAFVKLSLTDFNDFLAVYFGPATSETLSLFSEKTGEPMGYMYYNDQARAVIKITTPFLLFGCQSYFITTILVSIATYSGLWKLYRMFVSYFPHIRRNLAIAILFMPSVVFWGSGILKDSYTLAATCFFLVAINDIIQKRGFLPWKIAIIMIASVVIISIKAYIFLILMPGALIWFFNARIQRIANPLLRTAVVPITYIFIFVSAYTVVSSLGDRFGRFSLENALETAVVTQKDLKKDYYEGNSFDIGPFESTPSSVLSKFPIATVSGLYRPFLPECKNVVMLFSGIENTAMLLLTFLALWMVGPLAMLKFTFQNPLITCCFIFAILFAFMIGLTTSNFGALVRFKIPLIPLYVAALMVLMGTLRGNPKHEKFVTKWIK